MTITTATSKPKPKLKKEPSLNPKVINGKGDKTRPLSISLEQYQKNWEKIFKNNGKK